MTQTCPECGEPASGRFCSQCGSATAKPRSCPACGAEVPAGARFCTQCGAAVTAAVLSGAPASGSDAKASAGQASNLPWFLAGTALLALIVVIVAPRFRSPDVVTGPFTTPPITGPSADPSAIDLSAMSPREAADRLFNRVMQAVSAGDTGQAHAFLPMALGAYELVDELDLDGHYHVAVLHIVGDDPASARARADTILSRAPTHLFGLYTAAQAEMMMGNADAATRFYASFLENHDQELAAGRPEYTEHAPVLPAMREEAEAAVGRGG